MQWPYVCIRTYIFVIISDGVSCVALTVPIRRRCAKIGGRILMIVIVVGGAAAAATSAAAAIRKHFTFVVLFQMLPYFGVAMFIIRNDDLARIGRGDARFAIELPRQIALPIFLIFPYVLDAEWESIMHQ